MEPKRIEVRLFLAEIAVVCRRHGMSLGHEDHEGGFLVQPWNRSLEQWLLSAADESGPKPPTMPF